ncbi:SLBB domain-containing protein [Rhizobiaceae bacterium n13]|uniref:SLBB domain-containing protein n=1 Tax=Ferirhizobium litorale TaxID=2927786 RepID=A0AAE3U029_9HYPH|nr:polysaccharide biosynthesis/export family protein [Fererhizobium litorale]MDI7860728.1 SLBB domain-containing protein [Fererhizobium litorale]MDI7920876.1 SLBB domain-containing protein [Fererhizobium litorale]
MGAPQTYRHALLGKFLAAAMLGALGSIVAPGYAVSRDLPPQTKIRLTIVQWIPTKGVYEQWSALGGEYQISEQGTVALPMIGTVPVGDLDNSGLAAEIAKRLRDQVGLVDTPAATVEIVEYPPVYVVGDVSKPGEYKFRPGLTVLQALATSGGAAREANQLSGSQEVANLLGELRATEDSMLRTAARIARLEAEMSGAKEIRFPQPARNSDPVLTAIYDQENRIFSARANMLEREAKSLSGLRELLNEEIKVLEEKIKSTDEDIKSGEEQVRSTKALIEKGAIVPSRLYEVERVLRGYHGDRLDLVTSVMRARQNISQATRDLEGIYDKRQSEVASELQTERAALVQLELKQETKQKLLQETLTTSTGSLSPGQKPLLAFTVIRRDDGKSRELEVSETTALEPGDVVKVTQRLPEDFSPPGAETSAAVRREQASKFK